MHSLFWCSNPWEIYYQGPWTSFVVEASGSQPAGETWDLCLLFLISVTGNFLPSPSGQATNGSWMRRSWGLSFCCWDETALLSSTRHLAHRSTRCPHTRSWSRCRLSPLARPSQAGPQLACLRLRKYRHQKLSFSDTLGRLGDNFSEPLRMTALEDDFQD